MKSNAHALGKKAIKAALNKDWKAAVELNLEVLEEAPKDIPAKIRLGRAYLELKEFAKAKKLFKEVLESDPINSVAKKNYELAKSKTVVKDAIIDKKSLIREPGTTDVVWMEIIAPRITANNFKPKEMLNFRINKNTVTILKEHSKSGETDIHVGNIEKDYAARLKKAKDKEAEITIQFIEGNDKQIKLELTSTEPVFRAEKQEVRPYFKQDNTIIEESPFADIDDEE
ncbi:MAG: tetratricopeptide repeat protein [Patescibacteria group bacterium]